MKIGKKNYKLLLMDTNIIREVILNNKNYGKFFLEKFFVDGSDYVPCFSIYNVIELKPYENIYNKLLEFFSVIPCIMLYPYKLVIQNEYDCYINKTKFFINNLMNVYTIKFGKDNFKKSVSSLWENDSFINTIEYEIRLLKDVSKTWMNKRIELKRLGYNNNFINDSYYFLHEKETILKDLKIYDLESFPSIDYTKFPSLRIMEYSLFNRIYLTSKEIKPNDVMDIKISTIVPYVDSVITENYQANVYKKAIKFIPEMKNIEVYTLRNLR